MNDKLSNKFYETLVSGISDKVYINIMQDLVDLTYIDDLLCEAFDNLPLKEKKVVLARIEKLIEEENK
jgi:hypothetical protein